MKPPIVWLPDADRELKAASAWYNNVGFDLGARFARASTKRSKRSRKIHSNSESYIAAFDGLVSVAFLMEFSSRTQQDRILVVACFHAKRDPKHWQSRGAI